LRRRHLLPGDPPSPIRPPPGCHLHPRCSHAQDICRSARPDLAASGAGHATACHLWRDIVSSGAPAAVAGAGPSASLQRLFEAFERSPGG
jgi:peptide/nickel transport system ATP-binding protein/oligopeptide transport system ATP-binding protein